MRRALFRLQYARLALPMAAMALVLFGGLGYLLEFVGRGRSVAFGTRELVDFFVASAIVFAAAFAGAVPFGRTFKERQIIFLHVLPMPRWQSWLMTSGAALAAYSSFILISMLLRPSMFGHMGYVLEYSGEWLLIIELLLMLFAAGACGALLGMHPAATFIATIGCAAACIGAAALGAGRHVVPMSLAIRSEAMVDVFSLLVLPVVIPALFLASVWLFVEGEVFVARKIPRRAGVIFAAMVMCFVGGDLLARFAARTRGGVGAVRLSPDRSRIAILEGDEALVDRRVTIFDARTGKRVARYTGPYDGVRWLPDGSRLMDRWSGSLASVMIGRPISLAVERWSANGVLLETESQPEGTFFHLIDRNPPVLTTHVGSTDVATVATLRTDGRVAQQVALTDPRGLLPSNLGSSLFVRTYSGSRVLRIRERIDEVSFADGSSRADIIFIVGTAAHRTPGSAVKALTAIAPLAALPVAGGARSAYVCDTSRFANLLVCSADQLDALVWTNPRQGDVYRFDPRMHRWIGVAARVRLLPLDLEKASRGIVSRPEAMRRLIDDRLVWIANDAEGITLRLGERVLAKYPVGDGVAVARQRDTFNSRLCLAGGVEYLRLRAMRSQGELASALALDLHSNKVVQGPWLPFDPTSSDGTIGLGPNGERIMYEAWAITTKSIDGRVLSRVVLDN